MTLSKCLGPEPGVQKKKPAAGDLAFVESNKLTVRYHEVPGPVIDLLKSRLEEGRTPAPKLGVDGPVLVWPARGEQAAWQGWTQPIRAPVLPDLRSGIHFFLMCHPLTMPPPIL